MNKGIKVKLTTDLTKYAADLVAGTEGVTIGNCGTWSRGSDRFVTVDFSPIAKLDVLWDALEIIDSQVLAEIKTQQRKFEEDLKTARDVTLVLGPRGGFKYLSYEYTDQENGISVHESNGFKDKAEKIIALLEKYDIPINRKIIK